MFVPRLWTHCDSKKIIGSNIISHLTLGNVFSLKSCKPVYFQIQHGFWKQYANASREECSSGFADSSLSVFAKIDKQNKRISVVMKGMISVIKYIQAKNFLQYLSFSVKWFSTLRSSSVKLLSSWKTTYSLLCVLQCI